VKTRPAAQNSAADQGLLAPLPPRPFFRPRAQDPLFCNGVSLDTLTKRYGTPLYVYSSDAILERFHLFTHAFRHRPYLICYAVKANSALAILKLFSSAGAGFDIVSGGELERVLTADRRAAGRVVFSGVGKTAPELDLALKAGIRMFNVESEAELELLAERAAKRRAKADFAFRVNPDVFAETHPYISTGLSEHKFGVAISEARDLYRKARKSKHLQAKGISVHIGSQIRDAQPFGSAAERVVELFGQLRADGEAALSLLDLGGGLGIEYGEAEQTGEADWDPRGRVQHYAAAVEAALAGLEGVELLLEPGRFLVAQAGALLTQIVATKQNGSKRFVITDAGMNDLIRPSLYGAYHAIVPVAGARKPCKPETVDIVGPVCESGDFFARDRAMTPVKQGDLLAILDTGAYGLSLSSNYNTRPRPAEVLIEGKKVRLIRRRETIQDLLAPEKI
jgi:diaminopimelate decarboxylase